MNNPKSLQEIQTTLNQINSRLEKLEKNNIDLHGRRIINAGSAVNNDDYTTLADLLAQISSVQTDIQTQPIASDVRENQDILIRKIRPTVTFLYPGSTAKGRIFSAVADTIYVSYNVYYDGAAFQKDDTAKIGTLLRIDVGGFAFFNWPVAGALTNTAILDGVSLNLLNGLVFKIATVQILTVQQTDIGAAAAVSALSTTNTAGATYTATEQTMLGQLKTDVTNLRTTLLDYKTRLDNNRTIIRAHGITA